MPNNFQDFFITGKARHAQPGFGQHIEQNALFGMEHDNVFCNPVRLELIKLVLTSALLTRQSILRCLSFRMLHLLYDICTG